MLVGKKVIQSKATINCKYSSSGMTDFGLTVPVSEITLIGFCRLPRIIKYRALSEFLAAMER